MTNGEYLNYVYMKTRMRNLIAKRNFNELGFVLRLFADFCVKHKLEC